ncbi:MAG: carotenoid oxygenase family protein, partial [Microvirga sp.]
MVETPAAAPFYAQGNFAPVELEVFQEHLQVEGSIPPELDGLYLRNGPNPLDHNFTKHWFVGDGMLHGVDLSGGAARWYRNRYVQTDELAAKRGGVVAEDAHRLGRSEANTNVVAHAGRILALVEDAVPTQVAPTLETIGAYDFGGRLATPFTAHPVACPLTGELHFFGYSAQEPVVTYHVADAAGELMRSVEIAVGAPTMMHGFAITTRNAVFMDLPVVADESLLATGIPFRWSDDYGARVGLIDRGAVEDTVRWFDVDPCYVFHPLNAYEDQDGSTVVDVVRYDVLWRGGPGTKGIEPAYLHRWRIGADGRVSEERRDYRTIEFPRGDPRYIGVPYRFGYAIRTDETGSGIGSRTIITYDVVSGRSSEFGFEEGTILSEFVMVPASVDAAEGEGWLIG